MESKRIFVAIKIKNTDHISTLFRQVQQELRQEQIKWVDPKGLHLTLAFLGETDVRKIGLIRLRLQRIAQKYNAFRIQLKALGAFPSRNRPRVLWMGLKADSALFSLQADVFKNLDLIQKIGDKRFSPHITLGRIKQGVKNAGQVEQLLSQMENWQDQELVVTEFILMESRLTAQGPHYHVLDVFKLSPF